ncbi:MAG: SIMPL domain-containing protein [Rubrivivax sp.]|nr:SIMPL domain-containing protein [Rubrivivax sp.]
MPIHRVALVRRIRIVAAWVACSAPACAFAQALPPPQNVVVLAASASVEVQKDWLTVVFSTTREAADAATVQSQLKLALDAALNEARKAARPGQVEVQTGGFSLSPKYGPMSPAKGSPVGITGWQGSTELIVEGRDAQTIAQLTARIQTLAIARVGFSLSREARHKVEGEVTAQAIERFRGRASEVARLFGFSGYQVREVSVSSDSPMAGAVPMMRIQSSRAVAEEALPVEAGKATVTATVSGSVQMQRP